MKKREKTGGRKEGSLNRTTREVKQTLQAAIQTDLDRLEELLSQLDVKDRLELIVKILPYVVPKQNQVALVAQEEIIIDFLD